MTNNQRACVIGSGLAGLMAARVLADHFKEVIVCERDARPDAERARGGAPQGAHVHVLFRRGQLTIEALFPGLLDDLVDRGAIYSGDIGSQVRVFMFGAWGVECKVGFGALQLTRPLLEYGMRGRVEALSNVSIRYGVEVAGLKTSHANARVTGVRLRAVGGGRGEVIHADLVIDTSGRGSVGLASAKGRALRPPREDIVCVDFGCASALFEIPLGFQADWSSLLLRANPPDSQFAFVQVVEGGRWLVSFGGRGAQRPEATEESFRAFAKRFPLNILDDLISHAKMLGPVTRYRFGASVHRRFDLLEAHPEGFLALGDAVCSLNPVYGHGMSLSAMQVEALAACLAARGGSGFEGLWRDVYPRILEAISVSWEQCLASDMIHEATRIERPKAFAFKRSVLLWSQKLSLRDPALRAASLRSANLVPAPGDNVTLPNLLRAQARIWLNGGRSGAPPVYRFKTQ